MKSWFCPILCMLVLFGVVGVIPALAQGNHDDGVVFVPNSSREKLVNIGRKAHTNHAFYLQEGASPALPSGFTPAQLRTAYGLPAYALGNIAGSKVIAIVDAFDHPTALADFNTFSATFGLPQETGDGSVFQVVYASGTQPAYDLGWSQEAALDVEWAHAMAPTAKIVLVEAASNSYVDLLKAVDVANKIADVREVSLSWGGSEFGKEQTYDSHFTTPNIVYFAASGDVGGQCIWPGTSPNCVSAGGTTLTLDSAGNCLSETAWNGSGGGLSKYESLPAYQNVIKSLLGGKRAKRGAPDISFVAAPRTGVAICWQGNWFVIGGTSVSAPALAGIFNLAASSGGVFATSTAAELTEIYANLDKSSPTPDAGSYYRDIIYGSAGRYNCTTSWDFVTGVGSCWGLNGK